MLSLLVDLAKFCLKWAVKLWPLWLVVIFRGLGSDLWDQIRLAYAAQFQHPMPDAVARTGHFAFEALGPAPLLVGAIILVGAKFRPKQDVTYAAGGVALSGTWSILANYWYLGHAYSGVNILNAAPLINPGVWIGAVLCFVIAARARSFAMGQPAMPAGSGWLDKMLSPRRKVPAIERAKTAIHDTADWMAIDEAIKRFSSGGIILGEGYRVDLDRTAIGAFNPRDKSTWGKGGTMALLRFDGAIGAGHVMMFSGAGGGKTTSVGVPTCLEWKSGLAYLDPADEVYHIVRRSREEMGRKVVSLHPERDVGMNCLDWLDISKDTVLTHVQEVVGWLAGPKATGENKGFDENARLALECVLLDILFDPDRKPASKTLAELARVATLPKKALQVVLQGIASQGASYAFGRAAALANKLLGIIGVDKTWIGVDMNILQFINWLTQPSLARLASGGLATTIRSDSIATGAMDVFVGIPADTLKTNPGLGRCIMGSILKACRNRQGAGERVLLLLDEVYQLGQMDILATVRDMDRKNGVTLLSMWQSMGQLEEVWGKDGARAWFSSTEVQIFAGVADKDTSEYVSHMCGHFGGISETLSETGGTSRHVGHLFGQNSDSAGVNRSEVKTDLITPYQVRQMRADEKILLVRNAPAVRCGSAIYFRRPDMAAATDDNRFAPPPGGNKK